MLKWDCLQLHSPSSTYPSQRSRASWKNLGRWRLWSHRAGSTLLPPRFQSRIKTNDVPGFSPLPYVFVKALSWEIISFRSEQGLLFWREGTTDLPRHFAVTSMEPKLSALASGRNHILLGSLIIRRSLAAEIQKFSSKPLTKKSFWNHRNDWVTKG